MYLSAVNARPGHETATAPDHRTEQQGQAIPEPAIGSSVEGPSANVAGRPLRIGALSTSSSRSLPSALSRGMQAHETRCGECHSERICVWGLGWHMFISVARREHRREQDGRSDTNRSRLVPLERQSATGSLDLLGLQRMFVGRGRVVQVTEKWFARRVRVSIELTLVALRVSGTGTSGSARVGGG